MPTIQNKTFDEIKPGDTASMQRTLQARDVRAWATAFGDAGMLVEAGEDAGHSRNYHGNFDGINRISSAWARIIHPLYLRCRC